MVSLQKLFFNLDALFFKNRVLDIDSPDVILFSNAFCFTARSMERRVLFPCRSMNSRVLFPFKVNGPSSSVSLQGQWSVEICFPSRSIKRRVLFPCRSMKSRVLFLLRSMERRVLFPFKVNIASSSVSLQGQRSVEFCFPVGQWSVELCFTARSMKTGVDLTAIVRSQNIFFNTQAKSCGSIQVHFSLLKLLVFGRLFLLLIVLF